MSTGLHHFVSEGGIPGKAFAKKVHAQAESVSYERGAGCAELSLANLVSKRGHRRTISNGMVLSI